MPREAINEGKKQVNLHLDEDVVESFHVLAPLVDGDDGKKMDQKKLMQQTLIDASTSIRKDNPELFDKKKKKKVPVTVGRKKSTK